MYSTGTPGWGLQPLRNEDGERLHQALVHRYAIRVLLKVKYDSVKDGFIHPEERKYGGWQNAP